MTILSYSQYCRYRSLCKRLENFSSADVSIRSAILSAIGGTMFGCHSQGQMDAVGAKVLFCRGTIVHQELQQHAFRLDHLGKSRVVSCLIYVFIYVG